MAVFTLTAWVPIGYSLSEGLTWKIMTKARRADRTDQYCLENSYGFGAHGGSR